MPADITRVQCHYSLTDTFIVDFRSKASCFLVITEIGFRSWKYLWITIMSTTIHSTQLHIKASIAISRWSYIDYSHKFIESALVRLERPTLPKHKDTRTVISQDNHTCGLCHHTLYDGHICCPKEGELYRKTIGKGHVGRHSLSTNVLCGTAVHLRWVG